MSNYNVKFQIESRGSVVQQAVVQASSRAEAKAKVASRYAGSAHRIRIISVEER